MCTTRSIESECHADLLQPTLDFLGKDLRELKPRRAQVSAGGAEAAAYHLACEAIAMLDNHPKDGYKGLDGHLATAFNTLFECGLPVQGQGEDAQVYEWDVDPFEADDAANRFEDRSSHQDEEFNWDDEPETERTSAVPGIHF